MKHTFCLILALMLILACCPVLGESSAAKLYYQGHASLRITTAEGKVIYVDPYSGDGYDLPADLVLVTHGHPDHNAVHLVKERNEDCQVITWKEALVDGEYKTFDLGYATVEAVQAGNNRNHDIKECVGWVITLADGEPYTLPGIPLPQTRWRNWRNGTSTMHSSRWTGSSTWRWTKQSPAQNW